jgi:hypothetical protein
MLSGYAPHVFSSLALVSTSTNLLYQKRLYAEQRSRLAAQITILESISLELKSDKPLSKPELERLRRLANPTSEMEEEPVMSWKEAIFGKKNQEE